MKLFSQMRSSERGSMAVEFVLILPILVLLIFGVIELGSAWYSKQMLVSASREGARLGALYNEDGTTNAEVEAHVIQLLNDSSFPGSAAVDCTGADGVPGDQVRVEVTAGYTFPILSRLVPGVLGSVTLTSVTLMRHE